MKTLILNFHGVGIPPNCISKNEALYWIDIGFFKCILDQVINRDDVILTFDDGNVSDYLNVYPNLITRGLTGKFFVCSGRINSQRFLTRKQMQEMGDNGMQFGTHGVTHHSWRRMPKDQLLCVINESRERIMDIIQHEVTEAACPYGEYGASVLASLQIAGIKYAYTSDHAWWDGLSWIVPRYTITNNHTNLSITKILTLPEAAVKSYLLNIKLHLKKIRN